MKRYLPLILITVALHCSVAAGLSLDELRTAISSNDVVWTEPGNSSADSMPLGNGDIGLNIWTEQNGDIVF